MLEIFERTDTVWNPPIVSEEKRNEIELKKYSHIDDNRDYLMIFQTEPYIDAVLIFKKTSFPSNPSEEFCRFTFHENCIWGFEKERLFIEKCLKNKAITYDYECIEIIYAYYAKMYPEWNLNRYYTKPMRMLDHIYHCMRKGTAKEMLYKAGLDELAENVDEVDEINLLSSKPSDIYEGLSMRTLRALNCYGGATLLSKEYNRSFVKQLQSKFPAIFKERMNNAQCNYLKFLIEGDLTVGEAGRLYLARRLKLFCMWAPAQYDLIIWMERQNNELLLAAKEISAIDPIYKEYIGKIDHIDNESSRKTIGILKTYLLNQRREYDTLIWRSNRKRDYTWQERDRGYVVRFPQTINDFCREAIYMCNCLMTYVDAYINNDTTVLFMRKTDSFNEPFITIEVFDNVLMQAYHRFNEDCTAEEAKWILNYCYRHGIKTGNFKFNRDVDELF